MRQFVDEDDAREAAVLQELIDGGELDGPEQIGIAKQVIGKGADSLSSKQRDIYLRDIAPLMIEEESLEEGFRRNMDNPHA